MIDTILVFRKKDHTEGRPEREEHICPEDAEVQIRYNVDYLSVWFTCNDEVLLEFVLHKPKIVSFTEEEILVEGFERKALGAGVYPFEASVWLYNKTINGERF